MNKYAWRRGSRIRINAQDCGEEIERIKAAEPLTAKVIVKHAKARKSPLHGAFTWDDTEAARLRREDEARQLLGDLVVVCIRDVEVASTRATVMLNLPASEREADGQYHHIEDVISDEKMYRALLNSALVELRHFKRKYEHLKELRPVVDAIARVAA